jgi:uncharacterized coiled-coil DUF342 family protein
MNRQQLKIIQEIADKYGESSPQMQQVVAGYIQYQNYKGDPQFQEFLATDKEWRVTVAKVQYYEGQVIEVKNKIADMLKAGDADKKDINKLKEAVAEYENYADSLRPNIAPLKAKANKLEQMFI